MGVRALHREYEILRHLKVKEKSLKDKYDKNSIFCLHDGLSLEEPAGRVVRKSMLKAVSTENFSVCHKCCLDNSGLM